MRIGKWELTKNFEMKRFGLGIYIDLRIGYVDIYLGPLTLCIRDYESLPF